ncbi:hypothetical protein BBO_02160 [Beauveria brongniartii RCEF 3172]|uniref:Uncharacterized protein n=1 Tax=Beauveria brongniartii RCEF 3172 TaxID=1081107 RepID=A0A167II28_9HYPO|nr:hypothetical protein BBO_02160 [Beauveria brongniartii RCEF 3172]
MRVTLDHGRCLRAALAIPSRVVASPSRVVASRNRVVVSRSRAVVSRGLALQPRLFHQHRKTRSSCRAAIISAVRPRRFSLVHVGAVQSQGSHTREP